MKNYSDYFSNLLKSLNCCHIFFPVYLKQLIPSHYNMPVASIRVIIYYDARNVWSN